MTHTHRGSGGFVREMKTICFIFNRMIYLKLKVHLTEKLVACYPPNCLTGSYQLQYFTLAESQDNLKSNLLSSQNNTCHPGGWHRIEGNNEDLFSFKL